MMILRLPYAVVQWVTSAALYFALVLIGLPAVALGLVADGKYRTPTMWHLWGESENIPLWWISEKGDTRWSRWWWMAIRNPVQGLDKYLPRVDHVNQYGMIDESRAGFQIRYRHTKWRDSLRIAWGKPRSKKGKREFYIGYKIGPDVDNTSFTIQFRPF